MYVFIWSSWYLIIYWASPKVCITSCLVSNSSTRFPTASTFSLRYSTARLHDCSAVAINCISVFVGKALISSKISRMCPIVTDSVSVLPKLEMCFFPFTPSALVLPLPLLCGDTPHQWEIFLPVFSPSNSPSPLWGPVNNHPILNPLVHLLYWYSRPPTASYLDPPPPGGFCFVDLVCGSCIMELVSPVLGSRILPGCGLPLLQYYLLSLAAMTGVGVLYMLLSPQLYSCPQLAWALRLPACGYPSLLFCFT